MICNIELEINTSCNDIIFNTGTIFFNRDIEWIKKDKKGRYDVKYVDKSMIITFTKEGAKELGLIDLYKKMKKAKKNI